MRAWRRAVLTINYRLGLFGFFAHPELTRESGQRPSGNYALLDQNAAPRRVHFCLSEAMSGYWS